MAGRTGKMTAEEIARRGPRIVLARNLQTGRLVYFSEDKQPAGDFSIVAKSYTLSYLKRIAKFN